MVQGHWAGLPDNASEQEEDKARTKTKTKARTKTKTRAKDREQSMSVDRRSCRTSQLATWPHVRAAHNGAEAGRRKGAACTMHGAGRSAAPTVGGMVQRRGGMCAQTCTG